MTLFAVVATPGATTDDTRLARIEPQLRKILPNHGFRLVEVKTRRLDAGQKIVCDLGDTFTATATLTRATDDNGKVQIRCLVRRDRATVLESRVATPPNQLFFCDQARGDGSHLLVGIGAR